jgi:hypothetical protein
VQGSSTAATLNSPRRPWIRRRAGSEAQHPRGFNYAGGGRAGPWGGRQRPVQPRGLLTPEKARLYANVRERIIVSPKDKQVLGGRRTPARPEGPPERHRKSPVRPFFVLGESSSGAGTIPGEAACADLLRKTFAEGCWVSDRVRDATSRTEGVECGFRTVGRGGGVRGHAKGSGVGTAWPTAMFRGSPPQAALPSGWGSYPRDGSGPPGASATGTRPSGVEEFNAQGAWTAARWSSSGTTTKGKAEDAVTGLRRLIGEGQGHRRHRDGGQRSCCHRAHGERAKCPHGHRLHNPRSR